MEFFRALLAARLMYLTFGTRTIGVVLIPNLLLLDVIAARRITQFSGLAIAFCFALIISQDFLIEDIRSYLDQFILTLVIVISNIKTYFGRFSQIWYRYLGWRNPLIIGAAATVCLNCITNTTLDLKAPENG